MPEVHPSLLSPSSPRLQKTPPPPATFTALLQREKRRRKACWKVKGRGGESDSPQLLSVVGNGRRSSSSLLLPILSEWVHASALLGPGGGGGGGHGSAMLYLHSWCVLYFNTGGWRGQQGGQPKKGIAKGFFVLPYFLMTCCRNKES